MQTDNKSNKNTNKIIIIGGVAGGATAATRLRRLQEDLEIIVFERGGYVSFANCGLPYHLSGTIPNRSKLLLQSPESFRSRYNIDVRVKQEVIKIDRINKVVWVKNLQTGQQYEESYDRIIISTGASPVAPRIEGLSTASCHYMRSIEDLDGVMHTIKKLQNQRKRALVLGSGFIGLEVAENLIQAGFETFLLEKESHVMQRADGEIADRIHQSLQKNGVNLFLHTSIKKIVTNSEGVSTIYLSNGKLLEADFICIAAGVKPRTELAMAAGLTIGALGGIAVDAFFQTSDDAIYAVGDAIEIPHLIDNSTSLIPLAWLANRQGRLVADAILNGPSKRPFMGGLGSTIVKIFELTFAATGHNEKYLIAHNIPYLTASINRLDHAGYYPNAQDIILKLFFTKEGNILGAQGIGPEAVAKNIDLLACAIQSRMTIYDLQEIEITYAPPYNSAKSPVNILGYLAENMLTGMVKQVRIHEIDHLMLSGDYVLLDVRTPAEYKVGTIANAINIELDNLRSNIQALDKTKKYIVFCRVGFRSYNACRILMAHGIDAFNLDGGYTIWEPTINSDRFKYFIGIHAENSHFETTLINYKKETLHTARYPNNTDGKMAAIEYLNRHGYALSDILFVFDDKSVFPSFYDVFYQLNCNMCIVKGNPSASANPYENAKYAALSAANNPSRVKLFQLDAAKHQAFRELTMAKSKLMQAKMILHPSETVDTHAALHNSNAGKAEPVWSAITKSFEVIDSEIKYMDDCLKNLFPSEN